MNKLVDDHQARRDAEMLAARASNDNGGIRTREDAENTGDGNVVALRGQDGLLTDAAWDELIDDNDWIGKR